MTCLFGTQLQSHPDNSTKNMRILCANMMGWLLISNELREVFNIGFQWSMHVSEVIKVLIKRVWWTCVIKEGALLTLVVNAECLYSENFGEYSKPTNYGESFRLLHHAYWCMMITIRLWCNAYSPKCTNAHVHGALLWKMTT